MTDGLYAYKGPKPALTKKPPATVGAKLPYAESTPPLSQWSYR